MSTRIPLVLFSALALVALSVAEARAATLRLGTLAPKHSPWGKVFEAWSKTVEKKTDGSVDMQWLWNGVAGPERSVIGKMRTGQLSGAAVTAIGLSAIHKPIVALQMPGAFHTWAALDSARERLRPDFDRALRVAGFEVIGWGDVGIARAFSKGFEIAVPNDLRGHTPVQLRNDVIGPKVGEIIGGITPRVGEVNDILPLLRSGAVDVLTTPALAAEQLQWAAYMDHVNSRPVAFGVGALVMSKSSLDALPAEERELVVRTGEAASRLLVERIRKEDDGAYERLRGKMKVHDPTAAESAEWERVWQKACTRVKEALPGEVLQKIGYC